MREAQGMSAPNVYAMLPRLPRARVPPAARAARQECSARHTRRAAMLMSVVRLPSLAAHVCLMVDI